MNKPEVIGNFSNFNFDKIGNAQSILGGVEELKDTNTQRIFFKKKDPEGLEFMKFHTLFQRGIEGPFDTFFNASTEELITSGTNVTVLSDFMRTKEGEKLTPHIVHQVSRELKKIHQRVTNIEENLSNQNPAHTNHPIQNFGHRFINQNSSASLKFLESTTNDVENLNLPQESINGFNTLHQKILKNIEKYLRKLEPIIPDSKGDTELCFGDAKPENIIVSNISQEFGFIDPSFTLGSHYFDYSKLISRLMIEGITPKAAIFNVLMNSGDFNIKKDVYRGLSIVDLIRIDMTNILSSYMGRVLNGDTSYRMVKKMTSPNFLNQMHKGLKQKHFTNIFGDKY